MQGDRKASQSLTISLHVRGLPAQNYWFGIYPRSAPRKGLRHRTDYEIKVVYLGLYKIQAGSGVDPGHEKVDCDSPEVGCKDIDLWNNPDPILCCFFDPKPFFLREGSERRCSDGAP